MPTVATNKSAKLFAYDGTGSPKSLEIYPMEGDLSFEVATDMIEFLHRGAAMADGEGVMQGDVVYQPFSFSYALHDLTDAVKTDALIRWMGGDTTTTTAIASASWTSTTTRTDGKKTLDFRFYPQGTASGAPYYTIPDAIVTNKATAEGMPTIVTVTLKSTTATQPVLAYV